MDGSGGIETEFTTCIMTKKFMQLYYLVYYKSSELWNSLPLNCRTAPSVNTLKIRLKTFLFDSHNRTVARASVLWRDIN